MGCLSFCSFVRPFARLSYFFRFRSISSELFYRNYPNFVCALILTWSSLRLLHIIFPTFVPELWPLICAKILFLLNILRTNGQNFTKFYICIHIDKIYVGIVTHFSLICTRVMALDLSQNFVSIQYLEKKWTEFHQILYMHSNRQDLHWDCYILFFAHLYQSYGPWFWPKFCFHSISWEQMDRISPNFIYAFILTTSTLGLLHTIFADLYQSYGPWFMPKLCFRSISWEEMDRISPNFIYAIILTRSMSGLLHIIFCSFVPELWPLIYSCTNGQILTKLHITIYSKYWQDQHWDC